MCCKEQLQLNEYFRLMVKFFLGGFEKRPQRDHMNKSKKEDKQKKNSLCDCPQSTLLEQHCLSFIQLSIIEIISFLPKLYFSADIFSSYTIRCNKLVLLGNKHEKPTTQTHNGEILLNVIVGHRTVVTYTNTSLICLVFRHIISIWNKSIFGDFLQTIYIFYMDFDFENTGEP